MSSSSSSVSSSEDVTPVKIALVGDRQCGKTALVHKYLDGTFNENSTSTGCQTYETEYEIAPNHRIHLTILDTPGSPEYDSVRPLSYTDADVILLCFSITQPQSLENVTNRWYPEIRNHCPSQPVVLVGCKSDLRNDINTIATLAKNKQITSTYDQGLKTAKLICALVYTETSSRTARKGVRDVFEVAALSAAGKLRKNHVMFQRQRSFVKSQRQSGIMDFNFLQARKERAKSCVVM